MFDDQVVVVTGGAGALGQAVVEHFLNRGAEVVAVDYSATLLTEALGCLLYTSPSPRDRTRSRMPSSA